MRAELRLLGPGVVDDGAGVVEASMWRTTKTFDLMRVLALSVGRPVAADTLVEHFWPTAEASRAGTSLRTATCQIRKVLGNDSVVRVGHGLMLQGPWVDVAAYRDLAAEVDTTQRHGHPAQVVQLVDAAEELYRDDLDVSLTECLLLHDARRELRTLRLHLLLEAAEAAGRCGDWRRSLTFAQRAAVVETSDRSTRALMRAWFAVGETAKPVEEFERLRRHLADEYGVDPAPQTRALYLEVVSDCAEWPPREMLVGRDDAVSQVVSAATGWLMDPTSPTGVIWLVGQAGSGREAVAREAVVTLVLPLAHETAAPGPAATVELLPDHGALTKGLAAMLKLRAANWGRILLVPVSEASETEFEVDDAVVRVPPLDRPDFHRLMELVLQGSPTTELEDELYEESRGLPGLACRVVRHRQAAGHLTWTPRGVDAVRGAPLRAKLRATLAALPLVLLGATGGGPPTDGEASKPAIIEERERRTPVRSLVST